MPLDDQSNTSLDAILKLIADSLARVESKVDSGMASLAARLDSKADNADIARLEGRMDGLETRVEHTERREAATEGSERRLAKHMKVGAYALTTLIALAAAVALLISALGH